MTAVILHLSDIHIRSKKDWVIDKAEKVAACAYASLPEASVVFIVVSGDIAWSGKTDEYKAAKDFLLDIQNHLCQERGIPVHFVIAPGNHDCNFDLDSKARQLTLTGVRSNPNEIDESVISLGCIVQTSYQDFVDELHSLDETRVGDKLWMSHRFTVENKEVIFDTLNVSWCSQLPEEPGSLVFPHERYKNSRGDEIGDLRIVVIHHPLNWFSQAVYHPFRYLLRTISNVVISGHEHVGGVGEDLHSDSGHSAYIEGCVLQEHTSLPDSSFNIAELNLADGTYRSTRFAWNNQDQHYSSTEEGSWSDFRTLPKKDLNRLPLVQEFQQLITDPGGAFRMHGSAIKLADVYIYPDMQEPLERSEVKRILSTTLLQDMTRLEGGALLSGEEKVGASSLLYMLFSYFYDKGFLPLYIRGADIDNASEKEIDRAIREAVTGLYGYNQIERFHQTPTAKKVLLFDDFDDGPIKLSSQRARLLVSLGVRFKYFLVTVDELFDFKTSIAPHTDGKLDNLTEYRLLPFGYALRAQLVRRWIQRTADDGTLDEGTLLARCDQAERLLDAVMARNIVPALPLYLLTLLQSIDAGVSGGFEESGLGEYYDFLIKEGFKSAKIPKKDWAKVIEYCTHLAWEMHKTEHKELSIAQLQCFTEQYSKEEVRVSLDSRLAELVTSRVLSKSGEYVRFRYHYIYYFLKGRFLASRLDNPDMLTHVKECCAHLYVRENANTILFLAHHATNDKIFLDCIINAVNAPFNDVTPIGFMSDDTSDLKEFVRDLPTLMYSGEEPEKVRERANRHKDEQNDGHDGLADTKQEGAELDFIPQMIALFKTVEILGQVLKNQIASVSRHRRIELLQLLMNGSLRAVRAYFHLFMGSKEQTQEKLVDLLTKKRMFREKRERQDFARKLLAQMLQLMAFGFIAKAVSSISSDELVEDIKSAAGIINTPAAKLIAIGVQLDSSRDVPRDDMRKLLDDVEKNFIAMRVLQMLTLQRLYMFRTTEKDKQWLDSQKVLGIKMQAAIDFRTQGKKLRKKD